MLSSNSKKVQLQFPSPTHGSSGSLFLSVSSVFTHLHYWATWNLFFSAISREVCTLAAAYYLTLAHRGVHWCPLMSTVNKMPLLLSLLCFFVCFAGFCVSLKAWGNLTADQQSMGRGTLTCWIQEQCKNNKEQRNKTLPCSNLHAFSLTIVKNNVVELAVVDSLA